jgi:hypothetical protein
MTNIYSIDSALIEDILIQRRNGFLHYNNTLYSAIHNQLTIGMTADLFKQFLHFNETPNGENGAKIYRPWECNFFEHFAPMHQPQKRDDELSILKDRLFIKMILLNKVQTPD